MIKQIAIYSLVDPRQPEIVRYIGQTGTPKVRHLQHVSCLDMSPKSMWIESLYRDGIFPQMQILEWTTESQANDKEHFFIKKFSSEHLTNSSLPNELYDSFSTDSLENNERQFIINQLNKNHFNIKKVAAILNITRQTLYNKMEKLKIN